MSKTISNPTLAALRSLLMPPTVQVEKLGRVAPFPPSPGKSRKSISREIETKARRSTGNTAQHVRIPYMGEPPKTSGAAAKLRREAMLMCPCRLCALALYPPVTFAEADQLGLRQPKFGEDL